MTLSHQEDDLNPDEMAALNDPPDKTGDGSSSEEEDDIPPGFAREIGWSGGDEHPPEDDEDEDEDEGQGEYQVPAIIEVLTDENDPGKLGGRFRRVIRREWRELGEEERRTIDEEIVKANREMIAAEEEKKSVTKKLNGEIAEHLQALRDAIKILEKNRVEYDVTRLERRDEERWVWTYHDVDTDEQVDEVPIPESERQTTIKF